MFSMLKLSSLFNGGLIVHLFNYLALFLYIFILKDDIKDLISETTTLKANLAIEKQNTENAFLIIDNQNLKLKQLKIDSEKISKENNILSQKLQKRFSTIETPKTDDCLSKLKFYDTLLLEFSNGNYSK
ncbi:hypothetical protein [Campylobacter concisus]|uniref:hypothetical protein n=1 Tax=Campylobacter concisus TaxID=199 RepID=UPI0018847C43|nr:hypothetical protein [Campylobacter concisus]MBE9818315.1 hypothetical protein [Campylobacter concisus]